MHVLTLPRAWRRHDDGEDTETWQPVAVSTARRDEVDAAADRRRVERRVDGLGLGSVAKLSLVFYGFVFASLAGGVLIVWAAISSLGYVHRFEHFMRSIGFRGFALSTEGVVLGLIGVAGALVLLATMLTLLAACAYNVVGASGHGLVIRMSEPTTIAPTSEPQAQAPAADAPTADAPTTDTRTPDEASHAA